MISFEDWKKPTDIVVRHFAKAFDINYNKTEKELRPLFNSYDVDIIEQRVRR